MVKNFSAMQETLVLSLGWEDPLEKELATSSSVLAWEIAWTEEPGGLQAMGSQRVRHNLVTKPPSPAPSWGIPGGSVGEESSCSAGDRGHMGSNPGSGRSLGEGDSNPL